ncbi:MAG: 2TM domain-containing protein [Actinomycetota bacterium]
MMARGRDDDELRELALTRLEHAQEFYANLLAYVLVNGTLVVIWWMSGGGSFWPIFPILGWGIGIAFHAWRTFRHDEPTETRIRRDMDRLRRG